ncbi:MAG: CrcB family protein [Halomonas sp.]|nr:CrcB family protein [Halomonas sp.]MDN6297225.1 CrcB family protein [Halomonas sp.]MDN6314726.1 CrcB family protein [Halomonas sp.]MDN6335847.1 CrcB family protein [Halomonas sp.]
MTALPFYGAVAAGSALGAGLRYLLALAAVALMGPAFWAGTLCANLLGSGLIAWYSTRAARSPHGTLARWHGFWTVGVCGGFTTFSLFSVEAVLLWQRQQPLFAFAYVGVSVAGWLAAARVGQWLAEA